MLLQRFRSWRTSLDQERLIALADYKGWFVTVLFGLGVILMASKVPVTSNFFTTDFNTAIIAWLSLCIAALLDSNRRVREYLSLTGNGILNILTTSTLQFFFWSLVVSSSLMGGAVLAAVPILIASYHGQLFQVSLEYPFGVLPILLALLGAYIVDANSHHLAILVVGGLLSIGAAFVMGGNEKRRIIMMKEKNALREALDAQILYERTSEVESVQSAMQEIRGTNHDAGNVLSGILLNLQFLTKKLTTMGSENQLSVDTLEMSNDLGSSVLRLRKLIERGRDIGGDIAHKEEVSLINVLSKSIDEHRSLFPGISFSFEPECARHISLALPGGEETLARVLTNILRNACQGDGVTAASHVDVSVSRDGEHECVTLLVRDDGPGFSEEQLNTPISYFQTTKVDGSGLGLYTTHRLMAASRGQLLYANRSTGGAEVSIVFPLAK